MFFIKTSDVLICCIIDNERAWCDYWSWELLRGVRSMNYGSCEHSGWLLWMAQYDSWLRSLKHEWALVPHCVWPGSMNCSVYYLASCLFMGGVKNCTQATNVGLSLNGSGMLHMVVPQDIWPFRVRYRDIIEADALCFFFPDYQSMQCWCWNNEDHQEYVWKFLNSILQWLYIFTTTGGSINLVTKEKCVQLFVTIWKYY